jgi:hypothetical protein
VGPGTPYLFFSLKEAGKNQAAGQEQEYATISATGSRSHTAIKSTFVPDGYLKT